MSRISSLKINNDILDDLILKTQIREWIDEYTNSKDIHISDQRNSDGKYVVDAESVIMKYYAQALTNDLFIWGTIQRQFDCSGTNVTSLKGSPRQVSILFDCSSTDITSLEGAPEEVNGSFFCDHTKITSLKGAPKIVYGSFFCNHTRITSLEGAPTHVSQDFSCNCTSINSLNYLPSYIGRDFFALQTMINIKENSSNIHGKCYITKPI